MVVLCRFCDCNPCMCGKKDYPNFTCRRCGYTPCICGQSDYEDKKIEPESDDFYRFKD